MPPLDFLRSLLFVPATSLHFIDKVGTRGADAVVLDLEDSIPDSHKGRARECLPESLRRLYQQGVKVLVRVNARRECWMLDLQSIDLTVIDAIMLPKVESSNDVDELLCALKERGAPGLPIVAVIESPRGVLACEDIASSEGLSALGFGSEDYVSCLGVTPCADTLAWPAGKVIACAHANALQCWGLMGSVAVMDDLTAFEKLAQHSRSMGFTGSVCIHPNQIKIINSAFSPSDSDVLWAHGVLDAYEKNSQQGQGAFSLDGSMIDFPMVVRAKRLLSMLPRVAR